MHAIKVIAALASICVAATFASPMEGAGMGGGVQDANSCGNNQANYCCISSANPDNAILASLFAVPATIGGISTTCIPIGKNCFTTDDLPI